MVPGSGVVLVVEDEPNVLMVVRDTLLDLGYTVLEADSGRAGQRITDSEARIDLLLADAARQQRPGLKVLFMTGYAKTVAVGNGQMEPGMQVITKPFALDALAAKVQDIISTMSLPHAVK